MTKKAKNNPKTVITIHLDQYSIYAICVDGKLAAFSNYRGNEEYQMDCEEYKTSKRFYSLATNGKNNLPDANIKRAVKIIEEVAINNQFELYFCGNAKITPYIRKKIKRRCKIKI